MDERTSRRIVLLGKAGAGKSSLANTILGEDVFKISHLPTSEKGPSRSETKYVKGKSLTLIDTRSVFDTCASQASLKAEIVRCMTECAPGPHAFLIVLKVEKFTAQEQAVITEICQYFSEDALKYAVIVFTHGDQLPEGMKIEEFVGRNESLSNLVTKCGGRCHVVDNKYWKDNKEDAYRSNQFQVAELLRTTDRITEANDGKCYTNDMLAEVKKEIQIEEERITQSPGNMSREEIRNKAKNNAFDSILISVAGTATGALLGALLGVAGIILLAPATSGRAALALAAQGGIMKGGQIGHDAAEGATSPTEAIQKAAIAVWKDSNNK